MSTPVPLPETVLLIDDEYVYGAITRAIKSVGPSLWGRLKSKIFGVTAVSSGSSEQQGKRVAEIASNGTGFTHSCRFDIDGEIVNVLLIKPEDGQLFGWLTLAEFHERVSIRRVLCISRALTLREDLRTGDLALVTQASAVPYPALYASRPPAWQEEDDSPREPQHFFLSDESLAFGREIAAEAVDGMRQSYIPEVHTGYARHPAWGGGMSPWASEQFKSLAADGLETLSEIPVGVYDFATRVPSIPVVCFNIIAGRAKETAAGDMARDDEKDPTRYAFCSEHNVRGAVQIVLRFLGM